MGLTTVPRLEATGGDVVEDAGPRLHLILLGNEVLLGRVHQPFPAQSPAGEGGDAGADGRQCALGDPLALIKDVAAADTLDQIDVLLLLTVDVRALVAPSVLAGDAHAAIAGAFGPDDLLAVASGAGAVSAEAQAAGPVGVAELGEDVVPDVAVVLFPGGVAAVVVLAADVLGDVNLTIVEAAPAAAAQRRDLDRRAVETPVQHVDVVDVLLADLVAGEPGEVIPVVTLPFELAEAFLVAAEPDAAAVPVALAAGQLADGTVVDALHQLDAGELVTPLRAADDRQAFLFGDAGGLHDFAAAGHVGRYGLLGEDVLAGVDGREHLPPAKGRGRRHQQQVRLAPGQLLVTVEAPEHVVVVDLDATLELLVPRDPVAGASDLVLKQVGQGDDLNARVGLEALAQGAVASSATAEQPDLNLARTLSVGGLTERRGHGTDSDACVRPGFALVGL